MENGSPCPGIEAERIDRTAMEREPEELQHIGFVGICQEAYKIVLLLRQIFAKITLALVLPLSLVFLLHIEITHVLFRRIDSNEEALENTADGSPAEEKILARLASEWTTFLLFKGAYLLAVLVFSLLSTSAVVYTVACVYTAKDITFHKVMTVVPKVWKRLMVTFLWNFAILLCYNTATILMIIIGVLLLGAGAAGLAVVVVIVLVYLVGLVYISIIWHLASVVSVLEDSYGISAMEKSKELIKGKEWVAVGIFLVLQLLFVGIEASFKTTVVVGKGGVGGRLGSGALLLSLLCMLILMALVMQTVVYFVCKAYHHQSIDKSNLADHLEVYLGEYVPLKGKDVQLQQFHV